MRGPEDNSSAEVLRAKQLEIVDDEGKVCAVGSGLAWNRAISPSKVVACPSSTQTASLGQS